MFLWFAGLAVVLVWQVFRDTAIDYRLVMVGALLPDVVDAPFGGPRLAHTLAASVMLLVGVMVATRGRRGLRRRLLALPVGTLLHLVLDGMWTRTTGFWWPMTGATLPGDALPSLARPVAVVALQEAVGLAALVWWWRRFHLGETERRRAFARTGRLGRDLAG
ncbi:MAG: hypothetical protein M3N28_07500 [Actinomycetota bacterium]|nr:hypothetical protein [Actinomycetota bacterium]